MRRFVTFEASNFPDEAEWTAKGDPLVPDGRSVSKAIADALKAGGFEVTEPKQHSFYGWSFEVLFPGRVEWLVLQGGEPWLIEVEELSRSVFQKLLGTRPGHLQKVLMFLYKVLKQDQRFSKIQWFTEQEYHSGAKNGHPVPFDDPAQGG